ncbi:MAG: hypothetical protein GY704_07880 [Phycisphaeraceae bacterium]|nr:hypothetical protein [Phycisphaeraceae bacterium]
MSRLGLASLDPDEANRLLAIILEVLERRVGEVLTGQMTASELRQFEAASDRGESAAEEALRAVVPHYADIVEAQFEVLAAEITEATDIILSASGRTDPRRRSLARLQRPDPGPCLVGRPADWCWIVAPLASTVIALSPGRTEMYARRGDQAAVALALPDTHSIDPATVWCDERGEIRARFAEHSDLRWIVPGRPAGPILGYDKVLRRERANLAWTEAQIEGSEPARSGRWQATDGQNIEIRDLSDDQRFLLEPLHEGRHWNAVTPHFSPDGSQLVAIHGCEPTSDRALHACSVGYFEAIKQSLRDDDEREWPWEHRFPADSPDHSLSGPTDVGYDQSSTRAAVTDDNHVHLFHLSTWAHLGRADRPDGTARTEWVELPGAGITRAAWTGRSVVAVGERGDIWRIDLQHGDGRPSLVVTEAGDSPPVAVVPLGSGAVVVHRNGTLIGVDEHGQAHWERLPGRSNISLAVALRDGRLLVAADEKLELWSGDRLMATTSMGGAETAGLAPCAETAEWAVAWQDDGSVSTIRIGINRLSIDPGPLPHWPSSVGELPVEGAVMVDIDDWYLQVPERRRRTTNHQPVLTPYGWRQGPVGWLAHHVAARLLIVGDATSIAFDTTRRHVGPLPRPIEFGAPVSDVAAGECARSLVVTGVDGLWFVRLLT